MPDWWIVQLNGQITLSTEVMHLVSPSRLASWYDIKVSCDVDDLVEVPQFTIINWGISAGNY
jgi:hypothetical protein